MKPTFVRANGILLSHLRLFGEKLDTLSVIISLIGINRWVNGVLVAIVVAILVVVVAKCGCCCFCMRDSGGVDGINL